MLGELQGTYQALHFLFRSNNWSQQLLALAGMSGATSKGKNTAAAGDPTIAPPQEPAAITAEGNGAPTNGVNKQPDAAAAPLAPASEPAVPSGEQGNGTTAAMQVEPPQGEQQQQQQAADEKKEEEANGVSSEDIQLVQNLIERCLQLYMTRDEVISVLKDQATIESRFTQLVWQKLEEQNPEFFRCYYTRLKLKAQIVTFNHLLEQQVQVVQRMQRGWISGGMGGNTTASAGIPLFQGGSGGLQAGPTMHGGKDQVVPDHGEDFAFPSLDAGPSPGLFGNIPHIGSEPDLAALGSGGQNMPTPGELEHSLTFLPTTSPLTAHAAAHLGDLHLTARESGGGGSLPRNFSLSELANLAAGTNSK